MRAELTAAIVVTVRSLNDLTSSLQLLEEQRLRRAELLAEMDSLVKATAAEAAAALEQYGHDLDAVGESPDLALVRHIYWDHPEIKVTDLQTLLKLRGANQVFEVVGPNDRDYACRGGCGKTLRLQAKSRTDPSLRSYDARFCGECTASRIQRHEAIMSRPQDSHLSEMEAQVAELRRRGVAPARVYEEYAGVGGTWPAER